jgi:hypothetical protein
MSASIFSTVTGVPDLGADRPLFGRFFEIPWVCANNDDEMKSEITIKSKAEGFFTTQDLPD